MITVLRLRAKNGAPTIRTRRIHTAVTRSKTTATATTASTGSRRSRSVRTSTAAKTTITITTTTTSSSTTTTTSTTTATTTVMASTPTTRSRISAAPKTIGRRTTTREIATKITNVDSVAAEAITGTRAAIATTTPETIPTTARIRRHPLTRVVTTVSGRPPALTSSPTRTMAIDSHGSQTETAALAAKRRRSEVVAEAPASRDDRTVAHVAVRTRTRAPGTPAPTTGTPRTTTNTMTGVGVIIGTSPRSTMRNGREKRERAMTTTRRMRTTTTSMRMKEGQTIEAVATRAAEVGVRTEEPDGTSIVEGRRRRGEVRVAKMRPEGAVAEGVAGSDVALEVLSHSPSLSHSDTTIGTVVWSSYYVCCDIRFLQERFSDPTTLRMAVPLFHVVFCCGFDLSSSST